MLRRRETATPPWATTHATTNSHSNNKNNNNIATTNTTAATTTNSGEEMTRYTMELILKSWIDPHIDTAKWEYYDLSCVARDDTEDQVLRDAVEAGARIGAIFKEPTITPVSARRLELHHTLSHAAPPTSPIRPPP